MQLTWFGHACVLLAGKKRLLIDPFVKEGSVRESHPDLVAVTHGHADHMGEVIALKKRTIAVAEIAVYLKKKGLQTEGMNVGGSLTVDGVRFTMTPAIHSGGIDADNGLSGGIAAGFVIEMDGVRIYHAGDTGLFSDMKLIGDLYRPDVSLLPIGGRYTMGVREAMMAANFVGAKIVIPIHYNTWDVISADPHEFKRAIERTTDMRVLIPHPGETLEISSSGSR